MMAASGARQVERKNVSGGRAHDRAAVHQWYVAPGIPDHVRARYEHFGCHSGYRGRLGATGSCQTCHSADMSFCEMPRAGGSTGRIDPGTQKAIDCRLELVTNMLLAVRSQDEAGFTAACRIAMATR